MPHASYNLRRYFGPIWKWRADHRGEAVAEGYALSRRSARWAARSWLRSKRPPLAGAERDRPKLAA